MLSTCNRVEVYAAVTGFHGGLGDIGAVLAERAGLDVSRPGRPPVRALRRRRRSGTPSGSPPGSTRWSSARRRSSASSATRTARPPSTDAAGRLLHELMQQALRVGKRVHAETGIDRAGQSVVTAALEWPPRTWTAARRAPGAGHRRRRDGRLAVATLRPGRASGRCSSPTAAPTGPTRLAEAVRRDRRAVRRPDRGTVRLSISWSRATASPEPVLTADPVAAALGARAGRAAGRSSTWPCRATWRRTSPACPACTVVDIDRARPRPARRPAARRRRRGRADRRREVEAFLDLAARRRRRADRRRPARPGRRGGRRRAAPAGRSAAPTSPTSSGPRSPTPCTGSCSGCCTRRRCGCASSPPTPGGDQYAAAAAGAVRPGRAAGRAGRRRAGDRSGQAVTA